MTRNHKLFAPAVLIITLALSFCVSATSDTQGKSGEFYEIKITTTKNNGKTIATIKVTGKSGFKCNTMYPWKLTVKPKANAKVDKVIQKKADAKKFTKETVVFEVPYLKGPKQKLDAELKMSMCNDKICKMEKVALSW